MNSEKINAQHLVTGVANKTGDTKKDTDLFLREFIALIEEALYKDKIVKVKGLGTFKLVWNASRKSVNVQTGEEIEIAGHYKVNFTAENELKDFVNEPYAHLETVILDNGDEEAPVTELIDERPDPLKNFSIQAKEIASLISELNLAPDSVKKTDYDDLQPEADNVPTEQPPGEEHEEKVTEVEDIIAELRKVAVSEEKLPEVEPEKEEDQPVVLLPVTEIGSNADNEVIETPLIPEPPAAEPEGKKEELQVSDDDKQPADDFTPQNENKVDEQTETYIVTTTTDILPESTEPEIKEDENIQEPVVAQPMVEQQADATEVIEKVVTEKPKVTEETIDNSIVNEETKPSDNDISEEGEAIAEMEPKKSRRVLRLIADILALSLVVFLLISLVHSCFYNPDCGCYELIMKKERAAAIRQDDQQIKLIGPLTEEVKINEPTLYYDDPITGEQVDYRNLIIPPKFNPRNYKMSYVRVKSGDYLANYAEDHYGDARFWPYVFLANRDILPNPNSLRVGQRIKVPQLPKEMIDKDDAEALIKAKYIAEHLDEY